MTVACPDRETVQRAVADYITGEIFLREAPLGDDEDLFDSGFDSMSLTRLLVFVEERFGVLIPDQDVVIDEVSTIVTMSAFIHGRIEVARSAT